MKRHLPRDALAAVLNMVPRRRLTSGVLDGRQLLRAAGLSEMAECLTVDPYATAEALAALAERFQDPPNPSKGGTS